MALPSYNGRQEPAIALVQQNVKLIYRSIGSPYTRSMVSSEERTLQFDRRLGRHAWLQLTQPAAIERARAVLVQASEQAVVYDPFAGTATTGIVAADLGLQAYLSEINPFLAWLGTVKSRNYAWGDLAALQVRLDRIWSQVRFYSDPNRKNWQPAFVVEGSRIGWTPRTAHVLAAIRRALAEEYGESNEQAIGGANALIWVAFCQLLLETTTTMMPEPTGNFVETTWLLYQEILDGVVESVADGLVGSVQVVRGDARQAPPPLHLRATHVIATPPAPNRQSETKTLTPIMAWLRFLNSLVDASECEWQTIGGIWGFPPQNLANWRPTIRELPPALEQTLRYIRNSRQRGASILAQYFLKYFHDLHLHLMNLRGSLTVGARLHYFTKNVAYKGIPVHTEHILKESLYMLGYAEVCSQPIDARDRAVPQEFCVLAQYRGR